MQLPMPERIQSARDALAGHYGGVTTFSPDQLEKLVEVIREASREARDAV